MRIAIAATAALGIFISALFLFSNLKMEFKLPHDLTFDSSITANGHDRVLVKNYYWTTFEHIEDVVSLPNQTKEM